MTSKIIIVGIVALSFVAGSMMVGSIAYAASGGNSGQPFQALWDAIDDLQEQIDNFSFVQDNPDVPALEIQVDPSSTQPALSVNDGTNVLFTVNNDGSIQIGSNTVIIKPDGTVEGGPLFLQAGSTVDGQPISTGPHTIDTTLTEKQVDAFVSNNGFLSSVEIRDLTFDTATQAELDAETANRITAINAIPTSFTIKTTQKVENNISIPAGQSMSTTATCGPNDGTLISGGSFATNGVFVSTSKVSNIDSQTWEVSAKNTNNGNAGLWAVAICAKIIPVP